jgi:hypothetical protein
MIPALFLVICVVAFRAATGVLIHSGAATWLSNFAPLAAITLCCAAYLPRRYKFALPLITLFISDLIVNATYHAPLFDPQILCRYFALILVGLIGFALRRHASFKTMAPASLAVSVVFYAITNTFSWLTEPGYAKDFAGFIEALTVGLPQYGATPTWMFFRNSLLSDFTFTIVFVLLMRAPSARSGREVALARAA